MDSHRLPSLPRLQHGLTLVELMVAMALGLLILTAASTLFVQHNQHQVELDKANRLIDNGRYSLELLSENLRLAGYYGEFDPSSAAVPGALPDPCKVSGGKADLPEIRNGIAFAIQAYDAANATATASAPTSCALTGLKPGSDVLVIRRAATTLIAQSAIPTSGNNTVYIQGSACETDPGGVFKVDTSPANLQLLGFGCTAPYALAARMITEVYFVAANNVSGDGIPTLKKVELKDDGTFSTPVPLVEGVEFLQIAYGIDDGEDNNGDGDTNDLGVDANSNGSYADAGDVLPDVTPDGVPDTYVSCAGTTCDAKWDTMVAVKLYLVARNSESTASYTDTRTYSLGPGGTFTPSGSAANYRRQAYIETVRLMNPALRREKP